MVKKRSKTARRIIRHLEMINQAAAAAGMSFDELAEHLERVRNILINRTMITHIEKEGIHCELHQTLNGFMLKTSFNPFENMKFLEAMDKRFHVTGVENTLENGVNAVVFNTREYKTENILEAIQNVLEETVFN